MKTRDKSYTIAGLILQATTLFIAAMTVYLDALSMADWVFTRGFTYLASLSLLGIGLFAIMLAYRHHSSILETNTLKIWGGFHVFGLLFFIIPLSSALISTISPHVIIAHLVPLLILLIPPVLIIAAAQKEILEVLLNEPGFYETSKQKITTDLFDVPILKQIAVILLEMLNEKPSVSLTEILARVESVEAGNLVVELAESGEKKGNFQTRLNGALEALQQYQQHKEKSDIKSIKDEKKFLERFIKNTGRRNPRNMGMT